MTLQKKTLTLLNKLGFAQKIQVASERGIPDILACVNGRFWGVEIKVGTDSVTAIQHAQLCRIAATGGEAWIVCSEGEEMRHITRLDKLDKKCMGIKSSIKVGCYSVFEYYIKETVG